MAQGVAVPPDNQKTDPASASPTPAEYPPATAATGQVPDPAPGPKPLAEPLQDGTVPVVLDLSHGKTVKPEKGFASITRIYRRADIATTLITFVVSFAVAGLIIGTYLYLNRPSGQTKSSLKSSALDKTTLDQLNTFLTGNTSPQNSDTLYINSASLFKHRVAIDNDLKVTGGIQAGGPTMLGTLTVDQVATLGVTNIHGQLGVDGPTTLRGPTIMNAGASLIGNLSVAGNGNFGGTLAASTLNVSNLAVSGTLNLAGHLAISGTAASVKTETGAGSGATAQVDGNETAGTITFSTGAGAGNAANSGGLLVTVTFRNPYPRAPKVLITPVGSSTGTLKYYIQKTANGFTIGVTANPASYTGYAFDYWVIQ